MLTIQICNCQLLSDHDLVAPAFRNTLHDGQMAQSSFTLPQGGKEKTSIIDTLARWDLWCPRGDYTCMALLNCLLDKGDQFCCL